MKRSIKTYLKAAAKDYTSRSVNPPVVRASTILFKTMQELRKHQKDIAKGKDVEYWDYGRQGTQTTVQLQKLLRGLEEAYQVFLTPTGFSSVALAIMSICRPGDEILISTMEHHSNIVPWQIVAQEKSAIVKEIPIDENGDILVEEYKKLLNKKTKIVAITHTSNTMGTINPIKELIKYAHQAGAIFLVDAAQSVAHTKVDVQSLNCDFLVFSAHKIYGPTGIGIMYGKEDLRKIMLVFLIKII